MSSTVASRCSSPAAILVRSQWFWSEPISQMGRVGVRVRDAIWATMLERMESSSASDCGSMLILRLQLIWYSHAELESGVCNLPEYPLDLFVKMYCPVCLVKSWNLWAFSSFDVNRAALILLGGWCWSPLKRGGRQSERWVYVQFYLFVYSRVFYSSVRFFIFVFIGLNWFSNSLRLSITTAKWLLCETYCQIEAIMILLWAAWWSVGKRFTILCFYQLHSLFICWRLWLKSTEVVFIQLKLSLFTWFAKVKYIVSEIQIP